MSVTALKPYHFPAKDVRENFPAPLLYIGWEDHLLFCAPVALPLPADTPFGALAQAVIGIARSLKLRAIAEGVETVAQLDLVQRYGCNEIQGNYFSRPLTADKFETFARAHRAH